MQDCTNFTGNCSKIHTFYDTFVSLFGFGRNLRKQKYQNIKSVFNVNP